MKTKKLLSLFIASAISLQCAAVSVFASTDNAVTVVANDKDTDWKMQWNWERYEPGFTYYGTPTLTDGFKWVNNGAKYTELLNNAYIVKTSDMTYICEYADNGSVSGDYRVAFRTDANGNLVKYDEADTTSIANLWYYKNRANVLASFNVGETSNDGNPVVISFDYQSTNPSTGTWVNGTATSFSINGPSGEAFRLFNNGGNNGFGVSCSAGVRNIAQENKMSWDAKAAHSVKVFISPELTSDDRFEMTAVELDGTYLELDGVYGAKAGESDVLIKTIGYNTTGTNANNFTDEITNLKVERGIAPVSVTSSVENGATDVNPSKITLSFTEAVTLNDGAVMLYENGKEMPSSAYTVTMNEDGKTAVVAIASYKSYSNYKIVVDKTKVVTSGYSKLSEDFEVSFTTGKKSKVVANDKDTDWVMQWNWERYEPGFTYYGTPTLTDGFKWVNDGAKYTELLNNAYIVKTSDMTYICEYADNGSVSGDYRAAFRTDSNGNLVKYDEADTTSIANLWYYKNRTNVLASFNVGETSNDGNPVVISFDYQSTNPSTGTWVNGTATSFSINGPSGEAFRLFNNGGNNGFGVSCSAGVRNIAQENKMSWDAKAAHSVKVFISPELTSDGRFEMTAVELDGIYLELDGVYGAKAGESDVLIKTIGYNTTGTNANNFTDEITNLKVERVDNSIVASSTIADGATDVIPENIAVNFSDAVAVNDGAVKVYENGKALDSSAYEVTMSDDNKTAYVTLNSYKSRQPYTITVDKSLVSGLTGGEMTEDFELNFVTAKNVEDLEGSDTNLAEGYTLEIDTRTCGHKFADITTVDGVTTITIDNDKWNTVKNAGYVYDLDGDGNNDSFGWSGWEYLGIGIKNIADAKNSNEPLVISMDYAYENMNSSGDNNDMWINCGDNANTMYYLSVFGASPAVSGANWGGEAYANNVSETNWHSVQYVIDPTIDENGKTHMTQITFDGEVTKDTAQKWVSYGTANDADEYLNNFEMRIKCQSATDANGAYLPTVLKMKNLKVLRAGEFNAAVDLGAVSVDENVLKVRFSDPVSEAELANLKVLKGSEAVEDAISAINLSEDGKSADVTLNLDATARYLLVVSEVANIYGVKAATAPIEFEYYNTTDFVTITNAQKSDDGTNTNVSFTITSSEDVSGIVIAAAYDKENNLVGVVSKPVTVEAEYDTIDSVVLEKVTGADRVSVMVWDGFSNMKPYCMAKIAQ